MAHCLNKVMFYNYHKINFSFKNENVMEDCKEAVWLFLSFSIQVYKHQ